MSDIKETFAAAVRAARRRKGMTQLALAEAIDGSIDGVSAVERGINVPTLDTAVAMIRALDIDANAVFAAHPVERRLTRRRRDQEAELQEVIEGLDDAALTLLLDLARAVSKALFGHDVGA